MRKLPEALKRLFKASQKGHAMRQAGFTLIELLVVIGILGILISAMVATINPFEQINKGNDANMKNIGAEFVNGNIRYYTNHTEFPWVTSAGAASCPVPVAAGSTITTLIPCIDNYLDSSGDSELKDGFKDVSGLDKLFVTTNASTNSVKVCFLPKSTSGQEDKATKYTDATGSTVGTTCKSQQATGGVNCYWCTE
ncbi:MAG: hypothetical protein A2396_03870 [Candidatus Levybacteria bacterium RIFOXYB1_FULL_40_17]|nr:MAG: hypothetical protein A2396_03870 [Candidatus Levybacteria bacterium RIFOXYB1_FULL_40_17]